MLYLDNNATTAIDPDVLAEMQRVSGKALGNPGSRHLAGRRARQVLEEARESIAEILQARPTEVIFTSGGTESNNLALYGMMSGRCGTILLPPGEHPSIEEPVRRMVQAGWQRRTLPVDSSGLLQWSSEFAGKLAGTMLVTTLLAHNETGVIQDLEPLARACLEQRIPFHVDAVQAVGKIDVSFQALPVTTLSAAAHKFHGPRGIGLLLVRSGAHLASLFQGGHQEEGLRPGTEPVMLAAGMAAALRKWHQEKNSRELQISSLRDRLEMGLLQRCPSAVVNGVPTRRLPNTLNIAFPGCDADAMLIALDLAGLCCSLGSACASGSNEPSPILIAMGLPEPVYRSALRLSLSKENTLEEIDQAIELIAATVQRLRKPEA